MSYVVLARKYRPNTFSEVVGQEHVTRTLANAFAKDRVHHAFLFCGPRGVGKTTLARILGKALNCERGPTAEPCGECSACVTITNGTAVDYFEMDGASNRGIDAIRELTEAVRYQPAVLRKKVYVIDEVHMLTTEAFNALLKTLEEPPPHVSFVLATTEPHKVPNTILSRCQRYDFKLVPAPKLGEHLRSIFARESIAIEPGAISLIVRESGGSVRDSLSLCDQVISYVGASDIREADVAEVLGVADRALTRSLVTALAEGDTRGALEAVDAASERGVDEVQLARAIVRYLRDLAVMQVAPDSDTLVEGSEEERRDLGALAQQLERARVTQMFDRMVQACNDLGQTQQPRLVLDLALIDVAALEPVLPLGDLLDRLAALERRLGGGGGGGRGGGPAGGRGASASRGRPSSGVAPSRRSESGSRTSQAGPAGPVSGGSASETPGQTPGAPAERPPEPRAELRDEPRDEPRAGTLSPGPGHASAAAAHEPARAAPAPNAPGPEHPAAPAPARTDPAGDRDATSGTVQGAAPAAAAPPRVAMDSAGTPEDMLDAWERMLPALGETHRSLAGFFEHAKILSWRSDRIEVGFTPELSPVAELAAEPDNLATMQAFLRQHLGRPIELSIRVLSADEAAPGTSARSVVDMNRARAEDERRKRELEARSHPIYKKVLDTFGRPVREEIRTDV